MHRLRMRKPSASLVVAIVALIVALGGTAIAASKLVSGDKLIKKHSLSGNRLKNHTLTGTQIKVSSLPKVPSAAHADSAGVASSAGTATNSGSVDGMQLTSFTYAANDGSTNSIVLNGFDGLTLVASCTSGPTGGLTVKAETTQPATISWSGISDGGGSTGHNGNDSFSSIVPGNDYVMMAPGATVQTGTGPGFAVGQIVYSVPGGGARVSVDWSYSSNVGHDCYFTGTAVGSPSGTDVGAKDRRGQSRGSTLTDSQLAAAVRRR